MEDLCIGKSSRGACDAVVFGDAEGTIRIWNAGAEAVFGFTAAEAVGQSMDIIIPERLRGRHWDGYRRTMATGFSPVWRGRPARRSGRHQGWPQHLHRVHHPDAEGAGGRDPGTGSSDPGRHEALPAGEGDGPPDQGTGSERISLSGAAAPTLAASALAA